MKYVLVKLCVYLIEYFNQLSGMGIDKWNENKDPNSLASDVISDKTAYNCLVSDNISDGTSCNIPNSNKKGRKIFR